MFSRITHFLFGRSGRRTGFTRDEMYRMDIAFDDSDSVFDHERFMVENGHLVGITATIDDDEITETGENLPTGAVPSFEKTKTELLYAGKCTSILLRIEGNVLKNTGTAFFVGPRTLLTAGHNVANYDKSTRFLISAPGVHKINVDHLLREKITGIECTVVQCFFKANTPQKDIAILSSGSYICPYHLEIGSKSLSPSSTVDIVGYPGEAISPIWLRKLHPGLENAGESKESAEKLLPPLHLVASRGTVETVNASITYKISTCGGMSGSALVYEGKAYGISFNQLLLTSKECILGKTAS